MSEHPLPMPEPSDRSTREARDEEVRASLRERIEKLEAQVDELYGQGDQRHKNLRDMIERAARQLLDIYHILGYPQEGEPPRVEQDWDAPSTIRNPYDP